ncbi:MAG: YceD family protein [Candidatus Izemoplasmatales bacterium]|nr:YceD family protein [Candidatus Izemoplasmatales bacterium]
MKWTIHELIKKATNDNLIDESIDLRKYLKDDFDDFKDILETKVYGSYDYSRIDQVFTFNLNIKTTLVMICSVSLKQVEVKLDFDSQINFSVDYVDDDTHIIEGITIDLDSYIFSEILVEKPMRVVSPDANVDFTAEKEKFTEEEIIENNPFSKLKK